MDGKQTAGLITIIAKGTNAEADIKSDSDIRIAGKVKGDIETTKKLILTESGRVLGTVISDYAEIFGKFTGELRVLKELFIRNTANVDGYIFTKKIILEEGAQLNAIINTGPDIEVLDATRSTVLSVNSENIKSSPALLKEKKDLSTGPEKTPLNRYYGDILIGIPGSKNDPALIKDIQEACGKFMEIMGFELDIYDDPVHDPFFQKLTYIKKGVESEAEIKALYKLGKESLETSWLNKADTSNDNAMQKAADELIVQLRNLNAYSILIGEILLIQIMEDEVHTVATEIIPPALATILKKNPTFISNPPQVYDHLEG